MPISFSSPHRETRAGAGVTAVLGPTNTGKTHLAIERMLAHSSGMIGLPLRLLAREVYNKIVERIGPEAVALVTGEEKIKPQNPRYWVSTVEAMPRDLDVAFVAIDEIQLGADLERGHVFTDRMLNYRGREETLVLGAQTMRGMVERLLPGAHILSRPRLSQLVHAGDRKLTRLPRRSAIVAFSADEVYAIGELIRRQRGGVAVVLGALSPRTRNAQVALYQAGEVDYLVATDAIGMGLNLDVDHVAFASDRKFDGYQFRRLNPSEFAQIAGRAGRATRDGTFGTSGRCEPFEPELVQALESHSFDTVKILQWRNTDLDYASIGALQASLAMVPTAPGLTRAPVAEDIKVLEHAARDAEVRAAAASREAVARLWEVCQIPDYRKISPSMHTELAITLFGFLTREGSLPADWFARQIAQADRTDGDIDTLSTRIAHIRTWTFAANRPDWLADPEHWQGVTRAVEDKLSDALHERLLHRFVDRRTSVLMRRLRENAMLETEISKAGEVLVEGHLLGRLEGFRFAADPQAGGSEAKALRAAAQKALAGEISARATRFSAAADEQFAIASDGAIRWLGDVVGKLGPGEEALRPRVQVIADEHLTGAARDAVQARLDLFVQAHIEKFLGPLVALSKAEDIAGIGRGIAFQLVEALGVLERQKVAEDIKGLDQSARAALRKYGVRFGAYHIYMPQLMKPAPRLLALQLWALRQPEAGIKGIEDVPVQAASGRTSLPADKDVSKALYRVVGYRVCGERAVRVDILERLADLIRPALAWRPNSAGPRPPGAVDGSSFQVVGAMTSLVGSSGEDFASVLRALGYRMDKRPKPPEPEPAPATVEHAAGPAATAENAGEGAETAAQADVAQEDVAHGDVAQAATAQADVAVAVEADAAETVSVADLEAGEVEASAGPQVTDAGVDEAAAPQRAVAEDEAAVVAAPEEAGTEAAGATAPSGLPSLSEPVESGLESVAPSAETSSDSGTVEGAPTEAMDAAVPPTPLETAPAEPELIEVWRPGGRSEDRRPPRHRPPHGKPRQRGPGQRPQGQRRQGEQPGQGLHAPSGEGQAAAVSQDAAASGGTSPADAAAADRPAWQGRGRGPKGGQEAGQGKRNEFRREDGRRDDHRRDGRRPGRDEQGRGPRNAGKDRDRREFQQYAPKPRRNSEPDPNSPFAKLMALKEQLESDAKERR